MPDSERKELAIALGLTTDLEESQVGYFLNICVQLVWNILAFKCLYLWLLSRNVHCSGPACRWKAKVEGGKSTFTGREEQDAVFCKFSNIDQNMYNEAKHDKQTNGQTNKWTNKQRDKQTNILYPFYLFRFAWTRRSRWSSSLVAISPAARCGKGKWQQASVCVTWLWKWEWQQASVCVTCDCTEF